jgi:hypothetical protein
MAALERITIVNLSEDYRTRTLRTGIFEVVRHVLYISMERRYCISEALQAHGSDLYKLFFSPVELTVVAFSKSVNGSVAYIAYRARSCLTTISEALGLLPTCAQAHPFCGCR